MQLSRKDFFISYNKADRLWGEWIAWQLEVAGFSVVIQAWDFRPGSNFVLEMQKAATEAERTIAVLSNEYLDALYTQPEWAAAFVRDPVSERGTLLPVRVRRCELKGLLASLIYIDLVELEETKARQRLLDGIHRERAKPQIQPAFPGRQKEPQATTEGSSPFTEQNELVLSNKSDDKLHQYPKCFISLSQQTRHYANIIGFCDRVLPSFDLSPLYAPTFSDEGDSSLNEVINMINNASYGIYDLSYWRKDAESQGLAPGNEFIELGIAMGLNRPVLLLLDSDMMKAGVQLPRGLEDLRDQIVPIAGTSSFKERFKQRLHRLRESCENELLLKKRFCLFAARDCEYREEHPFIGNRGANTLSCLVANGLDTVKNLFDRYDMDYKYLDDLPGPVGYQLWCCAHCQTVRSSRLALYPITSETPPETFIALGITLALEAQFKYTIPKLLIAQDAHQLPSLLRGHDVMFIRDPAQLEREFGRKIPTLMQNVRNTRVRSQPIPAIIYTIGLRHERPLSAVDPTAGSEEEPAREEVTAGSMAVGSATTKVFILGRPGSGKSTVAQLLKATAQESGWDTRHMYDYKHLHDMFQQEIDDNLPVENRVFRQRGPAASQGFDVINFQVLDTVLKRMANEVQAEEQDQSGANKLLLIEFARREYARALDMFGHEVLYGAHLLYIKLDLEDCIERVHQRLVEGRSASEYDHFESDELMRGYYGEDDWSSGQFSEYLDYLRSDGMDMKLEELDNYGTREELSRKVEEFFHKITRISRELSEVIQL